MAERFATIDDVTTQLRRVDYLSDPAISGTVFLAVFVAMLAAMGFVLAPVVAMTEGARRGRPVARARRR